MNRNYCMNEKIYSAHREIVKDLPFMIRDLEITAFEVPHDGSDNVGYRIRYGEHTFALATDMAPPDSSTIPITSQLPCNRGQL
jgi:hypothetical protein